jgi:hypothetical protein
MLHSIFRSSKNQESHYSDLVRIVLLCIHNSITLDQLSWAWKQQIPQKRWHLSTELENVISWRIVIWVFTGLNTETQFKSLSEKRNNVYSAKEAWDKWDISLKSFGRNIWRPLRRSRRGRKGDKFVLRKYSGLEVTGSGMAQMPYSREDCNEQTIWCTRRQNYCQAEQLSYSDIWLSCEIIYTDSHDVFLVILMSSSRIQI